VCGGAGVIDDVEFLRTVLEREQLAPLSIVAAA
jgi:hypothetical protein